MTRRDCKSGVPMCFARAIPIQRAYISRLNSLAERDEGNPFWLLPRAALPVRYRDFCENVTCATAVHTRAFFFFSISRAPFLAIKNSHLLHKERAARRFGRAVSPLYIRPVPIIIPVIAIRESRDIRTWLLIIFPACTYVKNNECGIKMLSIGPDNREKLFTKIQC